MCEHCDVPDDKGYGVTYEVPDDTVAYIMNPKKKDFALLCVDTDDQGHGEIPIDYCPMCGRKLKED